MCVCVCVCVCVFPLFLVSHGSYGNLCMLASTMCTQNSKKLERVSKDRHFPGSKPFLQVCVNWRYASSMHNCVRVVLGRVESTLRDRIDRRCF